MSRPSRAAETERLTVYIDRPLHKALLAYCRDPSRGKAVYGSISLFVNELLEKELTRLLRKNPLLEKDEKP